MFLKYFTIIFVICGLLLAFCSGNPMSANGEDCPQVCNLNYDPVCATDGNNYKEFGNSCEFKANNCRLDLSGEKAYVATDMDWCTTELLTNLDDLLKKLDNLDLDTPDCMGACPYIYSPVCITNGKYRALISNECMMGAYNCALKKRGAKAFRVLQHGTC